MSTVVAVIVNNAVATVAAVIVNNAIATVATIAVAIIVSITAATVVTNHHRARRLSTSCAVYGINIAMTARRFLSQFHSRSPRRCQVAPLVRALALGAAVLSCAAVLRAPADELSAFDPWGDVRGGDAAARFDLFDGDNRRADGRADVDAISPLFDERAPAQLTWARNGLSIAIEQARDTDRDAATAEIESLRKLTDDSPSLILSWRGGQADDGGEYKLSALGRELAVDGMHGDVELRERTLGWGVNVEGGWRFGDLFTALSVTLGDGIDSLILNRFGNDIAVSADGEVDARQSISIMPRLNYSLSDRADVHLRLGRYQSTTARAAGELESVDTINLGYTWSVWPSALISVEVVGKDFDGGLDDADSTEIKIGAQQQF